MKDYDLNIHYRPGKANVVTHALGRKYSSNLACLITNQKHILEDLNQSRIEFQFHHVGAQLSSIRGKHSLIDDIKAAQQIGPQLQRIRKGVEEGTKAWFVIHKDGTLRFGSGICVT